MFCPYPFTRMEIKSDGSVYCCCEGWLPKSFGNILETSLKEIWFGEAANQVRQSIFNGSFCYCRACPYLPRPGGPVVVETSSTYPVGRVKTLKLDYDQRCNLACPSCRVTHSRHFVDVSKSEKIHEAMLGSGILEVTDRVYVTGVGDPFASPLFWHFLTNFPAVPGNDNIKIFLHTNGLLCDEDHWSEMGRAGDRVDGIGVSVDAATESTYKVNRGGSWEKLWDNIKFINRLQAEGRNIMLGMFYTVQANNFREIIPFIQLAFGHQVSWISITALRNWGTFTSEEYQERAVHLPGHSIHDEFLKVIESVRRNIDSRIVIDSFNPKHVDQNVICGDKAFLPASVLKRTL